MKLHYLFLALSACCLTISCGNSSKNQQTEVTTQQVNPLEEAFKECTAPQKLDTKLLGCFL